MHYEQPRIWPFVVLFVICVIVVATGMNQCMKAVSEHANSDEPTVVIERLYMDCVNKLGDRNACERERQRQLRALRASP